MDLDGYSRRAEAFTAELARRQHRRYAGLDPDPDDGPLYEAFADLFDRGAIERLRAIAQGGPQDQERATSLLRFAVDGHLAAGTARLAATLAATEAQAEVELAGGLRLSLGEALAAQRREADPRRRRLLEQARRRTAARELMPLALEITDVRRDLITTLGWGGYAQAYEDLHGIDLAALADQCRALLARTELDAGPALQRLGAGPQPSRADLPWLAARAAVPGSAPLRLLDETLTGLRLPPLARWGVTLDAQERPGKSRRAFCAAIRVPGEIHLVVPSSDGRVDAVSLLHEAGHALHLAATDPHLPFEHRRLGDSAVGEAFAFLLEGLIRGPGADASAASRLLLVRRYAAKLLFELALHATDPLPPARLAALYSERLSEAIGIDWPGDAWALDVDPGLYVAAYLRGWALEHAVRAALTERLGDDWPGQARAGALLTGLWRRGQSLRAEELLEVLAPGRELDLGSAAVSARR